jgi:hypothetical protein
MFLFSRDQFYLKPKAEKTDRMFIGSLQNAEQIITHVTVANESFENAANLKCLGACSKSKLFSQQNLSGDKIRGTPTRCHEVQNLFLAA